MREMVDSGVEWIGEIPKEWRLARLGDIYNCGMGETILSHELNEDGFPIYSATKEMNTFGFKRNLRRVLKKDSLIIGARGTIGYPKITQLPCGCTQTTIWCELKTNQVESKYFYYLIWGSESIFDFDTTAIPMLTVSTVSSLSITHPPLPEQQAIAAFLDRETDLIDRRIDLIERKREYLRELRKSVIHEAVTKGLDKEAEMVDSGVEWIGEIPRGWEIVRSDWIGFFSGAGIDKKNNEDEALVYMVNYLDVYKSKTKKIICSTDLMQTTCPHNKVLSSGVKQNDFLFTPSSETEDDIGHCAKIESTQIHQTVFSYHLVRYRVFSMAVHANFLLHYFNSFASREYFSFEARGTTRKILNRGSFKVSKIPLPPLAEQMAIAGFLDVETGRIDRMLAMLDRQETLLREQRKTLIHEVVTGKKNVNGG